jgi:hypothetical protein
MKYNCLLSIFIPVGILLSTCGVHQKIATSLTSKPHQTPLPNYVKHNPSTPTPTPTTALAKSTPFISVHLIPNSNKQKYIEYWITDMDGPGEKHSKDSHNNESATSTLFTTPFPLDGDIDLTSTTDGEVIIEGTATDRKCHAWKSDSKISWDTDVRWKNVGCK